MGKMYSFRVYFSGVGETEEEAWENATYDLGSSINGYFPDAGGRQDITSFYVCNECGCHIRSKPVLFADGAVSFHRKCFKRLMRRRKDE